MFDLKKCFFFFFLLPILFSCSDSCYFYEVEITENQVLYGYNTNNGEAYIGEIWWDYDLDNTEFYILDEYKGCKVTKLGGTHGSGCPNAFGIDLIYDEDVTTITYNEISDDLSSIIQIPIKVHLNSNVKEIFKVLQPFSNYYKRDEKIYHVYVYWMNNEKNEYYYAADGELYDKKTNNKVDFS